MLQRWVMERKPTIRETAYAHRHSRCDTWGLFRLEGYITDAQFEEAMRPYRHVLQTSKVMILVY